MGRALVFSRSAASRYSPHVSESHALAASARGASALIAFNAWQLLNRVQQGGIGGTRCAVVYIAHRSTPRPGVRQC